MRLRSRHGVVLTSVMFALSMLLPTAAAADPPANDSFQSPTTVGALPFDASVDISSATQEVVDMGLCTSSRTVWYTVTLAAGESIWIDARQTSFPTDIAVFSDGVVPIGANCSTTSTRSFRASSAGSYKIRLGTKQIDVQTTLNFSIYTPGTITGRVVDEQGLPIQNIDVGLYTEGGYYEDDYYYFYDWDYSKADGSYTFAGLLRGPYQLDFWDYSRRYIYGWYLNSPDRDGAQAVEVEHGPVLLSDQVLLLGGSVTGSVTFADGSVPSAACVELYRVGTWWYDGWNPIAPDGSFNIVGLPSGDYKLRIKECTAAPVGTFQEEWYQDAVDFDSATVIPVAQGEQISGIAVTVEESPIPANDEIANAIVIDELPIYIQQPLTKATTSESDPKVCGIVGRTTWYSYTPTENERLFMNVYGISATTAIHAVEADGSLSQVGCSSTSYWNSSTFELQSGKVYMLEVGSTEETGPAGLNMSLFDSEGGGTLHFEPSEPCLVRCPYWNPQRTNEEKDEDACAPTPASNEGSWQDHRIDVPTTINDKVPYALGFYMDPAVDHDVWFCRVEPDANGKYLVKRSANTPTQICDNGLPAVGCAEAFQAPVEPGKSYIIRVYNWLDPEPVDGSYWYRASKTKTVTAVAT